MSHGKGRQKKVKTDAPSSPKYVTSDEDTLSSDDDDSLSSELCKNHNVMIKGLMKQVGLKRVRLRSLIKNSRRF
jgi:hypothetical protein